MRKLALISVLIVNVAALASACLSGNESCWQRAGRQKRYLVFEKGGSFGVQANIAKAIISKRPRGLNQIAEYTLVYDLPQTMHVWLPKELHRRRTTTTPATTPKPTVTRPWPYWQQTNQDEFHYLPKTFFVHPPSQTWHRRHDAKQLYTKGATKKTTKYSWCRRGNTNKQNGGWCKAGKEQTARRHGRSSEGPQRTAEGDWRSDELSENLFYDVLGKWSELHGYNGRHCVMRTLCESRYLLMPLGHSLFHDIVRIMVRFALPAARRHRVYKHSLDERTSLGDCARLYGPHCRVSFLQQFTEIIHHDSFL